MISTGSKDFSYPEVFAFQGNNIKSWTYSHIRKPLSCMGLLLASAGLDVDIDILARCVTRSSHCVDGQ